MTGSRLTAVCRLYKLPDGCLKEAGMQTDEGEGILKGQRVPDSYLPGVKKLSDRVYIFKQQKKRA